MSPAEYIAELTTEIGHLEAARSRTDEPAAVAMFDKAIAEARHQRDDFLDFADGIYWPRGAMQ